MARATLSHQLHDLGLAAWFGGTLANAVSLNDAAGQGDDPSAVGAVANAGWDRWTPVNAVAIAAHLVGSVGLLKHDLGRVHAQQGVASMALGTTALTVGALGITAYSRRLGRTVSQHGAVPAADGTTPVAETPADVATAQRRLARLQWAVPAVTGALVAIASYASEQYRPEEVSRGVLQRFTS